MLDHVIIMLVSLRFRSRWHLSHGIQQVWIIRLWATTRYHFTVTGSPSSKQRCNLGATAANCFFTSNKPVSLWFVMKLESTRRSTHLCTSESSASLTCSTKLHVWMKDMKGRSDCLGRVNTLAVLAPSALLAETSSNYCGAAEASARLCFCGVGSLRKCLWWDTQPAIAKFEGVSQNIYMKYRVHDSCIFLLPEIIIFPHLFTSFSRSFPMSLDVTRCH